MQKENGQLACDWCGKEDRQTKTGVCIYENGDYCNHCLNEATLEDDDTCQDCHGTGEVTAYTYCNDAHIHIPDDLQPCHCTL